MTVIEKSGVTSMIRETVKFKIEKQSREEPIALIYEMVKKVSELEAEIARLKQPPTTSRNSSLFPNLVKNHPKAEIHVYSLFSHVRFCGNVRLIL
jgi:hypothetical protein